jgi:hypothetical protein
MPVAFVLDLTGDESPFAAMHEARRDHISTEYLGVVVGHIKNGMSVEAAIVHVNEDMIATAKADPDKDEAFVGRCEAFCAELADEVRDFVKTTREFLAAVDANEAN